MKYIKSWLLLSIFCLLLLVSLGWPACAGYASTQVPAVVSDESGEQSGYLIPISLKLEPGDGTTYVPTYPIVGPSTQSSADIAVKYAFSKSDMELDECNILIKIGKGGSSGHVEGPSAGVAFSVLTYAALHNFTMPTNIAVTGAVDEDGNVLRVGGLYEKLKMAAKNGVKYFISPLNNIHEKLLLEQLEKTYDVDVLEIENVDEAIDFIFYNLSVDEKEIEFEEKKLPELVTYNSSGLERFKEIAVAMIELENKAISSLPATTPEFQKLKEFFANSTENDNMLIAKGYLFTAANNAFLSYIDASSFAVVDNIQHLDLGKKKKKVEACLGSLKSVDKNEVNFELLIGADMRESWSLLKLNTTNLSEYQLVDGKYFAFNELMYADAWCHVSEELRTAAGIELSEQATLDETPLGELAKNKLNEAESLNISNEDLLFHLYSSKLLFDKGKYGAAIYDAVFVIKTEEANRQLAAMNVEQLKGAVSDLRNVNRSSMWGKLYQAHGMFITQEKGANNATAYRLFKFAEGLDEATGKMKALFTNKTGQGFYEDGLIKDCNVNYLLCFSTIVLALLFTLVFYHLFSKKAN